MLMFNDKQFNKVNFNGADIKRIIFDNDNMWAQEYDLSVQKYDTSISLPDGYLLWTTKTDPLSGHDYNKCHFGEVIETVFCDNGLDKVALPTGTYNITGPTTIVAPLIKFSAAASCDVEQDDTFTYYLSIQNPYTSDTNQIHRIPAEDLDSYIFIVQWLEADMYGAYSVGGAEKLTFGSDGYTASTTGGFVISLNGLAVASDWLNYYIRVRSGSSIYVRCTQVIQIGGVAAIRQNYSREAHEVFDTTGLIPDLWGPTKEDSSWQ